jgi:ferredoxin
LKVLYFSATGNSLYVAGRLGGETLSIPQLLQNGDTRIAADKIGLVFPIYFLSVPPYLEDFLSRVSLECDYLFAVLTYGNIAGAAPIQLREIAARNHLSFSYINTILMVDNWLPMFDMDKQIAGEPKKQIEAKLAAIAQDVAAAKSWLKNPSLIDKAITLIMKNHYPGGGICLSYTVDEQCNGCGICAQVCPRGNISIVEGKPVFAQGGISCLACTHNCPQNAIRLPGEKNRTRFRNQHVKASDIVSANRQRGATGGSNG